MLRPVMQQMAALAQGPHVAVLAAAVRGVVIEVRRRQHHLGRSEQLTNSQGGRGDLAAIAVAPSLLRLVPPATIAQMVDGLTMRTTADLAPPPARTNRTQWLICGQSIG